MKKYKIKHRWLEKGKDSKEKYRYGLTVKGATKEVIMFQTKEDRDWMYEKTTERSGSHDDDYIKFQEAI
jgi:hypothetical protein